MKEKIKIEGTVSLEIQGIEITSNNGNTVISGTVKNNGTVSEGDYLANILLLDEKQNALLEVGVYISKTEPKNETTFQTVVSTDLANAYSYTATKK